MAAVALVFVVELLFEHFERNEFSCQVPNYDGDKVSVELAERSAVDS